MRPHDEGGSSRAVSAFRRAAVLSPVAPGNLPERALLARYCGGGAYTDCYAATLLGQIDLARYIEVFYTTPLFKLERWLIGVFGYPSTDDQAWRLATDETAAFSVWTVEARQSDQILLRDLKGQTRSWLMLETCVSSTTLYFGSAIVPADGRHAIGIGFRLLLGFHRLYSRALLAGAARRLERARDGATE